MRPPLTVDLPPSHEFEQESIAAGAKPVAAPLSTNNAALVVATLNNQGAELLAKNRFEEAIGYFVHALHRWEQVADETVHSSSVNLLSYSLENCIIRSHPSHVARGGGLGTASPPDRCMYDSTSKKEVFLPEPEPVDESLFMEASEDRFIYRRPIFYALVPPPSAAAQEAPQEEELHRNQDAASPGITLSMIILLNLAIAHHMSAVQNQNCRQKLQQALQLYEIAHRLQLEEEIGSLRATMIISNNVGEIHRSVSNHDKHQMCLQHLLSTMMFMIDSHVAIGSGELEGYFRNTSQLICRNGVSCAEAA